MPRQPKLRASCDGCGVAKLKCDRGQPECGRCITLGLACVYGVSQKMGKPPRDRLRLPEAPSTSHEHPGSCGKDRNDSGSGGGPGDFDWNDVSAVEGFPDIFKPSAEALDALHNDVFGSLLPDFTSLASGNGISSSLETGPIYTLGSPDFKGYSAPTARTETTQPANSRGNDCFREAYDILGSLRSLSSSAPPASQSSADSTSATASTADQVCLDHVLRLNREASERLGHLLSYPCAGSTDLVLLYASIISQILVWYQQAAGCTQNASSSPVAMTLGTTLHDVSLMASSPSSGSGSGPWSNTAVSSIGTGAASSTPTLTQPTGLGVCPGKMAIGSFSVDDQRVQHALKIQLLLGEMRRADHLINQFTSHNNGGQGLLDEYAYGGVNNLYQNLDLWLRGEHSRIVNMMRSNLGELST